MANQDFGTVNHNNITILLTQQPYLHNDWYQAVGIDADENEYMVTWEITNSETEDESDACDWTVYEVRPL